MQTNPWMNYAAKWRNCRKRTKKKARPCTIVGKIEYRFYIAHTRNSAYFNHIIVSLLRISIGGIVNKTVKTIIGLFIGAVLLVGAFSGGFIAGHLLPAGGGFPVLDNILPQSQN